MTDALTTKRIKRLLEIHHLGRWVGNQVTLDITAALKELLSCRTAQSEVVAHVDYDPLLGVTWVDPTEALKLPQGTPLYTRPNLDGQKADRKDQ